MNSELEALKVLQADRIELIKEMAQCGANGGTGRIRNFVPMFNANHDAIQALVGNTEQTARGPGRPSTK